MKPEADVTHQFSVLEEAWDTALRYWHDEVALSFATHHWMPLRQESELYLQALRELMETLSAAEISTE